jgi:hypothetical protein
MKYLKTLNPPTKALVALLLPAVYLTVLNKALLLALYISFGMTTKEYNNSYLVLTLNILAGLFFLYETLLFLYSNKRTPIEY